MTAKKSDKDSQDKPQIPAVQGELQNGQTPPESMLSPAVSPDRLTAAALPKTPGTTPPETPGNIPPETIPGALPPETLPPEDGQNNQPPPDQPMPEELPVVISSAYSASRLLTLGSGVWIYKHEGGKPSVPAEDFWAIPKRDYGMKAGDVVIFTSGKQARLVVV